MRAPSRTMPPYRSERLPVIGWLTIAVIVMGALYLFWTYPAWLLVFPAFGLLFWESARRDKRRVAEFLVDRADESICTFARSFDTSTVDTWVIRAVYEEIQSLLGDRWHEVAIRADDDLMDDLELDDEDIDMSLIDAVAQRTGRSLDGYERNSYYGKVYTARDLVLFFNEQPRLTE